jgi:hypothetical protein
MSMTDETDVKWKSGTGTTVITRVTEELIPAIRAFNGRLDAGGAPRAFRFPESAVSRWVPKRDQRRLFEEYFALVERGTVRGCYIFKQQDFSFEGRVRPIGHWYWSISEGLINNKYFWVAAQMLGAELKAQPLLYGLAMTDQAMRLLRGLGWSVCRVPFYFKVHRPGRFLRELPALKKTPARRLAAAVAAASGLGALGLRALQGARGRAARGPREAQAELVGGFGGWADELWAACQGRYAMIAVRDSETLNTLYPAGNPRFLRCQVSRGGRVLGWAVLLDTPMQDHARFGNLRVGSLVDCLALPEDAPGVVRAATQVLEARGVDLLLSNQSHAAWGGALRGAGFLEGRTNFHFAASRALSKLLEPLPGRLAQMHLTRGDGEGPVNL